MNASTTVRTSLLALLVIAIAACSNDPASVTGRKLRSAFGDDAKGIEVRVEGSAATLTGTVGERSTAELAEEVAKSVPGITSVDNRISGPKSSGLARLGDEASDAALEIAVKAALVREARSDAAQALEIEACDGVVSLRGTVADRSASKKVVEVASAVGGVTRVIDLVDTAK